VKRFDMQLVDDGVFVPKRVSHWILRRVRHAANRWRNNGRGAICCRIPHRALAPEDAASEFGIWDLLGAWDLEFLAVSHVLPPDTHH
jgi:hypothetical protein